MRYLKRFFIFLVIAFTFWFVDTCIVKAAEFDYSVYYPTSTLGGLQFNNSSSYDAVNSNSEKIFKFNVSLEAVSKSYEDSPYKVGDLVNFQITYCISPLAKVNAVYSSLKNYLDFNYQTDNQCAIGDGTNYWYGQVTQYAFVRLAIDSISYDDIEAEESLTVWRYHFNTQSLNIINSAPYGASMRFISMEYLNKFDYNSLIAEYSTKADIDIQIDQNQQIIQGQDQIKDSITSDEGPSKLDALENSAGWLPPGPVDSILNLPLSLLNNLSTNLGKACQPVNLPLPFGVGTITLPCLSSIYDQIEGLNVWINTISLIAAAFILYSYLLKLYAWVDGVLTMRENTWNDKDQWGGL